MASIALNRCVKEDLSFDFEKLEYITSVLVRNLNKIVDINGYPMKEVEMFLEPSIVFA